MRRAPERGRAGLVALALGAVITAGCAPRVPRGMVDRFVTRDDGASAGATFDVAPPAPASADAVRAAGRVEPVVPIPKVSSGLTLETQNAALAAALGALAVRESVDGHLRAAAEYGRAGVVDQADRHLGRALAIAPRDARLFDERARLWRDAGALDVALAYAHRAAYLAPRMAEAQNTLGTVLYALGDVQAARDRFARAVALRPDAAYARHNLCVAAAAEGADGAHEPAQTACDDTPRLEPVPEPAERNRNFINRAPRARSGTRD